MRSVRIGILVVLGVLAALLRGWGADYFVCAETGDDARDGSSWVLAKQTIQGAVDAAMAGDVVRVTNGVYATGGRAAGGGQVLTNRVVVDKPVRVVSVNGPGVTHIAGARDSTSADGLGSNAVRCVWLADGAEIYGFTLTNGATLAVFGADGSGGGVFAAGGTAMVSNCVLSGNAAHLGGGASGGLLRDCRLAGNRAEFGGGADNARLLDCLLEGNEAVTGGGAVYRGTLEGSLLRDNRAGQYGGGAYLATLTNCTVTGNAAAGGGGAHSSTLVNSLLLRNAATGQGGGARESTLRSCTVMDNEAAYGGGTYQGTLLNSVVFYNRAGREGDNWLYGSIDYSCVFPLPEDGTGNLADEPLVAGMANPRLLPGSPCIDAGTNQPWMVDAVDWSGRPRLSGGVVDMGVCEFHAGVQTGTLAAAAGAAPDMAAAGHPIVFDAGIEGECSGFEWDFGDGARTAHLARTSHVFAGPGEYDVRLAASNMAVAAAATVRVVVVEQPIHYVSPAGGHIAPFADWASAATTLQAAVDAAVIPGAMVLVADGVYSTGGRAAGGAHTLPNRVVVDRPVWLRSVNGPGATVIAGAVNGEDHMRCAWLGEGAGLVGFTLTNGIVADAWTPDGEGGGVWCLNGRNSVSNCVLVGNLAKAGGGAFGGTHYDHVFLNNSTYASGSGGGLHEGRATRCRFEGNEAAFGGGANHATLAGCVLVGNRAAAHGGGTANGRIVDCTYSGNHAYASGGGAYEGTLSNCVFEANTADSGGGAASAVVYDSRFASNAAEFVQFVGGGGGAFECRVERSVFSGNTASRNGGAAYSGELRSSLLRGNRADWNGGGAWMSVLRNCTVVENAALQSGGGVNGGELFNSIVWSNSAPEGENWHSTMGYLQMQHTCTFPDPGGTGNIAQDPRFVPESDLLELRADSPCRDAGLNESWMAGGTDLAGNSRVIGAAVDMGAVEYLPAPETPLATTSGRCIRLDWPVVPGSSGYMVYRSIAGSPPGEPLAFAPNGHFVDCTAGKRAEYHYWISACYGADAGPLSSPVYARLRPPLSSWLLLLGED